MQDPHHQLTRRERQIIQAIFARGEATAKEVESDLPDPPSRTAIRTMLTILVDKKMLKYRKVGREFVYSSVRSADTARRGALRNLMTVFFGGSIESLLASHISDPSSKPDEATLKRLEKMIRDARKGESE
jgi:predicted transcriptional regulator